MRSLLSRIQALESAASRTDGCICHIDGEIVGREHDMTEDQFEASLTPRQRELRELGPCPKHHLSRLIIIQSVRPGSAT